MQTIEINPTTPPIGSVILLHGLGADGHDFVSLVPELQLPASLPLRFVFPHAKERPVTINHGYILRAWYDITSMNFENHVDEIGLFDSVRMLETLIEKEVTAGIPKEKIMLAGFSQGGVIALLTGLLHKERLAGIVNLSGYFPLAERILQNASSANAKTPIFMAHGTEDPLVPFILSQTAFGLLHKNHYPVSWHSYPMAHSVCMQEIHDLSEWIKTVY